MAALKSQTHKFRSLFCPINPPSAALRRGAKRKATKKAEAEPGVVEEKNAKQVVKANTRLKRVKPAKPEPELVEEKRSFEDLWIETFPIGTEWDNLDNVYQFKWDFTNLEEAFEERSKLYGQEVYLFGGTEPQFLPVNGEKQIVFIPHVVAVVSPFPTSDKIGINSVQRESEEIVPMKQMKMGWVPYIPLDKRCALKHLKINRFNKYNYCMPYFYNPFKDDEAEPRVYEQSHPADHKDAFKITSAGSKKSN